MKSGALFLVALATLLACSSIGEPDVQSSTTASSSGTALPTKNAPTPTPTTVLPTQTSTPLSEPSKATPVTVRTSVPTITLAAAPTSTTATPTPQPTATPNPTPRPTPHPTSTPIVLDDHGDDRSLATSIDLIAANSPIILNGEIETPGDVDTFSFETVSGDSFAFTVNYLSRGSITNSIGHPKLFVYAANPSAGFAIDDRNGSAIYVARGGAVYLDVSSYSATLTSTYRIIIDLVPGPGPRISPLGLLPNAIDFESPALDRSFRRIVNPYVDEDTGVTFTPGPIPGPTAGFGINAVVGLVKNSATSACTEPRDDNQRLAAGIDGPSYQDGVIGLTGFSIKATFPSPIAAPVTVSAEYHTGEGVTVRLRLFSTTGQLLASVEDVAQPSRGTCGFPGDPRASKVLTASPISDPVSYVIMDVPTNTVGGSRVFVIDNFKFG